MRIKFIGAAAAIAIMASGLSAAMAQSPAPAPSQQAQPSELPPAATPPAMTPPGPNPDNGAAMSSQPSPAMPDQKATPAAEHQKQHTTSACQKAIQASEKALEKSQASPDTIAQAWQHISTAKQEKGTACKDEAKQAQEML